MSEEQKTPEERGQAFFAEYKELVAKHQVDTVFFPVYEQQKDGTFVTRLKPQLADLSNQPVPSNFVEEEK